MAQPFPSRALALSPVDQSVTRGEVLAALSCALDITEGARPGHAARTCLLGMRIGTQMGLSAASLQDLYYALLLKDIGCSGNAARMAQAFRADDQVIKRNFKLMDREKLGKPNREALQFVWSNLAPGQDVWTRLRELYRMVRRPGNLTAEVIEDRCERGAIILHKLGMSIETCAAVYSLDEHWNGLGLPDHLVAEQIPLLGRICAVAQHLDLFCAEYGTGVAINSLGTRSGRWFDPEVVRAAESLNREGSLWAHCLPGEGVEVAETAAANLRQGGADELPFRDLDVICSGFADVVDAKSPYTYRHSVATTECAVVIGRAMQLAPDRLEVLRRAALLHDIGMLGVPNTILDKPGPLTAAEWATVQQHPGVGEQILSRVRAFQDVALLVGQHHERLDGSGYPGRVTDRECSTEARILAAADVLSAMMEHRPYRDDLSPAEVQQQLLAQVPYRLDGEVVETAVAVLDDLAALPLQDVPALATENLASLPLVEPPPFRISAA